MAPRSTWKGTISFGMVSMPVKVFKAVDDGKTGLNQLHKDCEGRVKMPKVCPDCQADKTVRDVLDGAALPLVKGFDRGDGYVVLTDADLDSLPVKSDKTVEVIGFAGAEEIGPVQIGETFFMAPDKGGGKAFALFLAAMQYDGRVAVGKISMRGTERLCAIQPHGQVMHLSTMHWPDLLRDESSVAADLPDVSDAEVAAARQLIASMSDPIDWDAQVDEREQALTRLIEAKVAGTEYEAPPAVKEAAPTEDILAALTASVQAVQEKKKGMAALAEV